MSADSCLIIQVRDTSIPDVESLLLGEKKINIEANGIAFPYSYLLQCEKPETEAVKVTVGATLHVNHCSESIKSGDFITVQSYPMNLTDRTKSSYKVDLSIVKYGGYFIGFVFNLLGLST